MSRKHQNKSGSRHLSRNPLKKKQRVPNSLPPAFKARCSGDVEKETQRHLAVLREVIPFHKLPDNHPIQIAWDSPTSMARFQLQHLADDIQELREIEGFRGLLKRLVTDTEAYQDYRYEMRMAASISRSKASKVLRLAGNAAGPDVEFESTNGKKCGLACYRARGESVPVKDVEKRCYEVIQQFSLAFYKLRIAENFGFEVIFPSFPPKDEEWAEASMLLPKLWQTFNNPEIIGEHGVVVKRCVKIANLNRRGIPRWARVRFMFKVSEREKSRVLRHIEKKLADENKWAQHYDGVPLFSYEVSPWDTVPDKNNLVQILNNSDTLFVGMLATEMAYPASYGIVHSLEDFSVHAPNLHLSFETFGYNMEAWAKNAPSIMFSPTYSCTYWDVREQKGVVIAQQSKPMSLLRQRRKLDDVYVESPKDVLRGNTIQRLANMAINMRDAEEPFNW